MGIGVLKNGDALERSRGISSTLLLHLINAGSPDVSGGGVFETLVVRHFPRITSGGKTWSFNATFRR